ncbi:hypothetical protein Syun_029275 [Stephania yunnanensis]|uniref:Uncharacterized protein n=1 Tax=Stephania yunnanensis TaxID=152371 RepID=A0AAP0HJP3_9MAGN
METLLVVPQHRNQYYGRSKYGVRDRFSSHSSRGLRDINCRFRSGSGILPTPLSLCNGYFVAKKGFSFQSTKEQVSTNDKSKKVMIIKENCETAVILKPNDGERFSEDHLSCSKLWAGPAYSNSPPPSSLPMPKFSILQKQCVSPESGVLDHSRRDSLLNTDSATKDLRRILHLDMGDE